MQIVAHGTEGVASIPSKCALFLSPTEGMIRRDTPRDRISQALVAYNQQLGLDQKALKNAASLADPGTVCVVAGQQLGFFGGPQFTVMKALSVLLLAKQLNAVPIFWWATEDHDLDEIAKVVVVDLKGNLQRFRIPFPHKGEFVEDLLFSEIQEKACIAFASHVGIDWQGGERGERYATAMLRMLAYLFRGTGLVFLEPYLLRPFAAGLFERLIRDRKAIASVLSHTTNQLKELGQEPPISVDQQVRLFWKDSEGRRVRLSNDRTEEVWKAYAKEFSDRMSTDVISRPLMQNALLPIAASVVGPTEMRYHLQLKELHSLLGIPFPKVVPRLSATFIPPSVGSILQERNIMPWELDRIRSDPKIAPQMRHQIGNTLLPGGRLQERILNWWGTDKGNMKITIAPLLEEASWDFSRHHYIWVQG